MSFTENLFNLKGKVAVVTGGGQGIGLMISTSLVQCGVKVYIASRKESVLTDAAKQLNSLEGGECVPVVANLATIEGCKGLVSKIKESENKIDILVNNAGATWGESISTYPDSAWDKIIGLNVKSIFNMTVQLLPLLKNAGTKEFPSRVINIGSVNGLTVPAMETYAYSASKAAVHHLSRHLANRLARDNITVNAIACGAFPSHMMAATLKNSGDYIVSTTPLQRIGRLEDIGGTVIYLSSQAGSWVTGTVLTLDGGSVLRSNL